jgi:hypothetical protein
MVAQAYYEYAGQYPSNEGRPSATWLVEWARTTNKFTFVQGNPTAEQDVETKDIVEAPLQPGDIFVLYYFENGKRNYYHSGVLVSLDGNGKLSNNDKLIMANWAHYQTGEIGEARKLYRVRLMEWEGLLREANPKYKYCTFIRASK